MLRFSTDDLLNLSGSCAKASHQTISRHHGRMYACRYLRAHASSCLFREVVLRNSKGKKNHLIMKHDRSAKQPEGQMCAHARDAVPIRVQSRDILAGGIALRKTRECVEAASGIVGFRGQKRLQSTWDCIGRATEPLCRSGTVRTCPTPVLGSRVDRRCPASQAQHFRRHSTRSSAIYAPTMISVSPDRKSVV